MNQPSMARARWVIASSSRQVAEAVTSAAGRGCADRRSSRRVSASTASAPVEAGQQVARPLGVFRQGYVSGSRIGAAQTETVCSYPHSYMRCNVHHHRGLQRYR